MGKFCKEVQRFVSGIDLVTCDAHVYENMHYLERESRLTKIKDRQGYSFACLFCCCQQKTLRELLEVEDGPSLIACVTKRLEDMRCTEKNLKFDPVSPFC